MPARTSQPTQRRLQRSSFIHQSRTSSLLLLLSGPRPSLWSWLSTFRLDVRGLIPLLCTWRTLLHLRLRLPQWQTHLWRHAEGNWTGCTRRSVISTPGLSESYYCLTRSEQITLSRLRRTQTKCPLLPQTGSRLSETGPVLPSARRS